jgi:hypothetical protein
LFRDTRNPKHITTSGIDTSHLDVIQIIGFKIKLGTEAFGLNSSHIVGKGKRNPRVLVVRVIGRDEFRFKTIRVLDGTLDKDQNADKKEGKDKLENLAGGETKRGTIRK